MNCDITNNKPLSCVDFELNNHPLKINWETMEVSIGDVTYGKLKGLIVANDKMEFTISLAETLNQNKMKQTAVEWFAKELNNWRIKEFGEHSVIGIPQEVFEQAKAMEKVQIMRAHSSGYNSGIQNKIVLSYEYYIKTFKSE